MNKHLQHSNRRETWETPLEIFKPLNRCFGFTIDLAANRNNALCRRFIGPDSLVHQDFLHVGPRDLRKDICWINPPYGKMLAPFTAQIAMLAQAGISIVALLPANLETGWFHDNVHGVATSIYARRGRIQFLYKGKRPLRA